MKNKGFQNENSDQTTLLFTGKEEIVIKFKISRTSDYGEKQPCKESISGKYICTDTRSVDSPSKLQYKNATTEWYENGYNHRVEDGKIKRDFKKEGWVIQISSIKQLVDLADKYGDIIISTRYGTAEIEIYDDYRE